MKPGILIHVQTEPYHDAQELIHVMLKKDASAEPNAIVKDRSF